jgi:hypothetical protein
VHSTNGHNAKNRLDIEAPIYNTQGELIATDAADLWDGAIDHAVKYNEFGVYDIQSYFDAWTGTYADGTWTGYSAGDWNDLSMIADVGSIIADNDLWIAFSGAPSSGKTQLYNLSPVLTVPLIGDYNADGLVNSADYTVWRDHLGQSFALGNRDTANTGPITMADYTSWKTNFGHPGAAATVPEPAKRFDGDVGHGRSSVGCADKCLQAAKQKMLRPRNDRHSTRGGRKWHRFLRLDQQAEIWAEFSTSCVDEHADECNDSAD